MTVLNRIAYFQQRRDEVPNQELARDLATRKDKQGIREIAQHLWHDNPQVQSDCLKVLYEVGYLQPELIADYVHDFLKLLNSQNNRLVWGSMIALATIAGLQAAEVYKRYADLISIIDTGSVITRDNGVTVLAVVASTSEARSRKIVPYLLKHLATCRPKDVPQHAERMVVAVNARNKQAFVQVLEKRMADMTSTQGARLKKVLTEADRRAGIS